MDGILNVLSAWTLTAGDRLRRIQSGQAQDYVYGIALGVLLLMVWMQLARVTMASFPVLSIITWAPFVGAAPDHVHGAAGTRCSCAGSPSSPPACPSCSRSRSTWPTIGRRRASSSTRSSRWCPPLGINYQLGVDGMSLLMVLLTSIIIFAGAWASWTVKERSQEFYALLLILVTGVYGVFVSLDLFVLFLFYEIAVLPMYLLIGIWGSSGEVRPQGIFGWAFGRTGVGTKEYAAMKLTLYLLFGSAFILVGILALYVAARFLVVLVPRDGADAVRPRAAVLGVPRLLRGVRHPGRHLAAPHLVARRPRLRARPRSPCSTPAC